MLTVHHLAASQSERIVWLCEELELDYRLVRHERAPNGGATAAFKALHPFGTAPFITDGDIVLPESGAIVDYLCRRYGGEHLLPGPDHPNYAAFLHWYHFANGSFLPSGFLHRLMPIRDAAAGPSRFERAWAMIEQRLEQVPWFAGDHFTAADIMMCLTPNGTQRELSQHPAVTAYSDRLHARPAFRRAMAKAEPEG